MWTYQTSVEWKTDKQGTAHCEGKPAIDVATPPEFGGPEGFWTPEDLMTAAVESCIMASALFFLNRGKIGFRSYSSHAAGTMEKGPSGLVFSRISVTVTLELEDAAQADAARKALQQAEKTCPLSNTLSCPVELTLEIQ
ncbi:OsmC family protein [Pontiella agarivorans]|uniref:OsmC family protein n=1 Tax=Pontiella agarivorans TaxID=3038953 RepID=A0ABU5MX87_9BACT|nr:OsmC family protein [Pontiella agarivorans]MDZ8118824.1 OsmC family protein [Pontiella agarivorans]